MDAVLTNVSLRKFLRLHTDCYITVHKIKKGLYLSGIIAAADKSKLEKKGITHIINLVGGRVYDEPWLHGREDCYFPNDFEYLVMQ